MGAFDLWISEDCLKERKPTNPIPGKEKREGLGKDNSLEVSCCSIPGILAQAWTPRGCLVCMYYAHHLVPCSQTFSVLECLYSYVYPFCFHFFKCLYMSKVDHLPTTWGSLLHITFFLEWHRSLKITISTSLWKLEKEKKGDRKKLKKERWEIKNDGNLELFSLYWIHP